ncbi:hypothetical protein LRAMOSA01563 [Lichtheimia ramosa]|uniref:Uncharacterized protein n=1 Tax=Lichtheimia ramosa TaxID=688394 RepID=A0A077WKI4_9FUNG|nr:hypothetical protein LRAMOSA01563 [Lichtheimia ramosa]
MSVSVTGGSFLTRRHSAGDALRSSSAPALTSYCPPSIPNHDCRDFQAPEGTYQLAHHIAFRSLQPTFSIGTTASLISIKYKESVPNQLQRYEPLPGARSLIRRGSEDEDLSSISSSNSSHNTNTAIDHPNPRLGSSLEGPSFLSSASPSIIPPSPPPSTAFSFLSRNNTVGRRIPMTDITRTTSSFVSRIVTNNQLAKILVARTSDDTNLFYNCGSNFVWVDAFGRPKEPLSRVVFAKACPTSHDVNILTRGSDHLDVIIGFTSGDIVWFDPLCNKYGRINKGGIMSSASVTMIRWLPGSENIFMASFSDGVIIMFDKDREDEPFHPGDGMMTGFSSNTPPSMSGHHRRKHFSTGNLNAQPTQYIHKNTSNVTIEEQKYMFRISKPSPKASGRKSNPVSHWKLSSKSITAFAFSPDCQHVAVVGLDGLLRVINFVRETLEDIYQSYYGGLTSVAWSPDGRYILTGGEDDLVTIWAFHEQRIIARCQGHTSWVTGVAFDPWRCDENVYRFASVGEDAKLILWDFSVNALHRPKARTTTGRYRGSSVSSQHHPAPNLLKALEDRTPILHPVQSKDHVAFLQPTMVKTVHADPCVGVYFREDVIVTTDRRGRVSIWQRPNIRTSNPMSNNI